MPWEEMAHGNTLLRAADMTGIADSSVMYSSVIPATYTAASTNA